MIRRTLGALAMLAAVLAEPAIVQAAPAPAVTRVVWARDARVYLAPADSGSLAPGDRVWFVTNGDAIASGTVSRVDAGGLALTLLDSGSLSGTKHLDRVDVEVVRAVLRTPTRITIGCAAPDRPNAILPQGPPLMSTARLPDGYRMAAQAMNGYVLVRDSFAARAKRPDTLVVRWFNDAVDQEIALERGELDVAVFPPGELSGHMREQPRWQGFPLGTRSRGALAWIAIDSGSPAPCARVPSRGDSGAVSEVVRDRFRSDLAAWVASDSMLAFTSRSSGAAPIVWADDPPHAPGPSKSLDRRSNGPRPRLKPVFLEASVRSLDSLALSIAGSCRGTAFASLMHARADSLERAIREPTHEPRANAPSDLVACLHNSFGVVQLFTLRCPVLCSTPFRPYVDTLGVDALADLMGRLPSGFEP